MDVTGSPSSTGGAGARTPRDSIDGETASTETLVDGLPSDTPLDAYMGADRSSRLGPLAVPVAQAAAVHAAPAAL
eukprot:4527273-Pyramimonas_sp.AAC.1